MNSNEVFYSDLKIGKYYEKIIAPMRWGWKKIQSHATMLFLPQIVRRVKLYVRMQRLHTMSSGFQQPI